MFSQYETLARQYAASTGQPYELCLKALQVAAWCKANPQGGVVNGQTYDAQATAAQLAEASRILTPKEAPQPPSPAATTPALPPIGSNGLSNRRPTQVGRSANDPQRMAEQRARQQRQNAGQTNYSGGGRTGQSFRVLITGDFSGFSGAESFRMNNGQVWRQIDGVVTHHNPVIHNPTAIITIVSDGTGRMELVGVPGSVRVQLLQAIQIR